METVTSLEIKYEPTVRFTWNVSMTDESIDTHSVSKKMESLLGILKFLYAFSAIGTIVNRSGLQVELILIRMS